jgi:catechol 2,3-dioxygenase-like lactoylglutathione lyase family enzyme
VPVPFKVRSIDHVEVFVRDIPAAIRWYGETLGLVEIQRWDPEPVMVGAGGTMLALFKAPPGARPWSEKEADGMRWHRVAWLTDRDGFEAAQKHLAAKGIAFRGPVDHGKSHSIYFHDPDGHPLEITVPA